MPACCLVSPVPCEPSPSPGWRVRAANQWRRRRAGGLIGRVTDTFAAIGPELHAKLVDVVARNRLPGAVAGVVHRNEVAWSATIRLADVTAGQPAELGTLFRIASITKPFTGTAIMQLRDTGMLDIDDPAVRSAAWPRSRQ